MILFSGERLYGSCDRVDDAYVATLFRHFQFLPFRPRGCFLVVEGAGGRTLVPLPMIGRSLLAGYGRIWLPLVTIYLIAVTLETSRIDAGLPAAAFAIASAYVWLGLGRLSAKRRRQHRAYATFAGAAVDVALLARATARRAETHVQRWLAETTSRAEDVLQRTGAELATGYRGVGRAVGWADVAAHVERAPVECLRAALTLARVASATAGDAAARREADEAHARIWARLEREGRD